MLPFQASKAGISLCNEIYDFTFSSDQVKEDIQSIAARFLGSKVYHFLDASFRNGRAYRVQKCLFDDQRSLTLRNHC